MTLAVRVIATLLYDPARGVVKGQHFDNWRVVGEPIQWARVMARVREVDELVIFDVTHGPPDLETIERIASETFTPLAYGGGIHSLETAREVLRRGADKVVISHHARPALIKKVAAYVGSQSVMVAVDHAALREVALFVAYGAGELLVQSKARDGTMSGYDLELIRLVSGRVDVPIVASSGAGKPADFVAAVRAGASAVAAGAIWQFTDYVPDDAKRALRSAGYPVRLREAAA